MSKNWNLTVMIGALAGWAALQGCAHSATQATIDHKLAAEPEIRNTAELRTEAATLIETSPGLNGDQRARLGKLRDSTGLELAAIHQKSLKLRALLIQDVISAQYDENEVQSVENRIRKLENQRLSVLFGAVEQANRILGREAAMNERLIRDLIEPPGAR